MAYRKRHINISGHNIRYCKGEERVKLKSAIFPFVPELQLRCGGEKKRRRKKAPKSLHSNLKNFKEQPVFGINHFLLVVGHHPH